MSLCRSFDLPRLSYVGNLRLKRGEDGNFNDDDLAKILLNATEWYSGSYKAAGTPEVLRVIEVLGIEQARSWGTCSVCAEDYLVAYAKLTNLRIQLNEFRKFMGLKRTLFCS